LSAVFRHFPLPDCIYRKGREQDAYLYTSEEAIFGTVYAQEKELVGALSQEISSLLPTPANLVIPLALGGHVDHRLTRQATEQINNPAVQRWYYADYPYTLHAKADLHWLRQSGWCSISLPVTEAGVSAWQASVAAHASQISTFWPDLQTMRAAIQTYCQQSGGIQLWRTKN
jgi:LmbE family N-acetylglucosaminyl deacetylase